MRTFYSLPSDYSGKLQQEIQQLIYYSNGGYSWYNVYHHMPVHHRKFHLRKLQEIKDEEAKQIEQQKKGNTPVGGGAKSGEDFNIPSSVKGSMQNS